MHLIRMMLTSSASTHYRRSHCNRSKIKFTQYHYTK